MLISMAGLVKRGRRWIYRREVPLRLRGVLKRREWKESLGTSDEATAQRRWRVVHDRVERAFKEAEAGVTNPAIAAYHAVEEQRQYAAANNLTDDDEEAIDIAITDLMERLDSKGTLDAHHKAVLGALLKRNENGGQDNPPLSLVFGRYHSEKAHPARTRHEWEKARERFTAAVGGDVPIRSVTKAMMRTFKDALIKTPTRHGATMLSPASIVKNLSALRSVLSWAVAEGWIDTNPADGITHAGAKRASQESRRQPYSTEDLRALFSPEAMEARKGKGANHWLPLLALFSGGRLEELGQLRVADVRHDDGVDYLSIEGGNGKRVKTAGSWRRIPIHPELVRLGLLDYVAVQRTAGHDRLFPELKANAGRQLTAMWSKWWGRHARNVCGIMDKTKVMHSFRHGFIDAAREVMPEEHRMAITGHRGGGVGRAYGSGVPLKLLAESMAKVRYAGLDLARA
jgi:integrase